MPTSTDSRLNISGRHITLSTCGMVPQISSLSREKLAITLAVSLHAPNDELRDSLMPINRRYPIKVLLEACREYTANTGRRLTFEYALIDGINDHPRLADQLGRLIKGMLCHVNLIPVNPVPERGMIASSQSQVILFKETLEKHGMPVTLRRSLGSEIGAACGQLRNESR
jgi:23S rRNA (adenine2503-C2)-methyltransferase